MCSSRREEFGATPSYDAAAKMPLLTTETSSSSNKRRKRTTVPGCTAVLPDDMIFEVLLRLPVESILRFRAVCRAWAALFSSKDFCNLHMASAKNKILPSEPKLLLFSPMTTSDTTAVYSCSASVPQNGLLFTFPRARRSSMEVVTPSPCCGLTLLFDAHVRSYYVCNAATRQVARLPPYRDPGHVTSAGLGFDARTKEYKVVRSINGYTYEKEKIRCDVYTPGADRWRPAAGKVPFKWSKFAYSAVDHARMNKVPPVFANGFLHWLINPSLLIKRPRAAIISFSVADETFGCIHSPPFWEPNENLRPWPQSAGEHLVVLDDQVCIVRNLRDALEIWGLLDYGSGAWSLNYRINLFVHVRRELRDPQVVRVIGSVGNCSSGKKIVIATSEHRVHDKFRKKVYTYDPRCQALEIIRSVTETHTAATRFIPGLRFSLFEESLTPVRKFDEEPQSTNDRVFRNETIQQDVDQMKSDLKQWASASKGRLILLAA
ncbi:unnamed protein product [Alopecurus aequalis]